jgi:hypothetical protein
VITIQGKVTKEACISYWRIDKMDEKLVAVKPARKRPL